jgi:hypothetical protein
MEEKTGKSVGFQPQEISFSENEEPQMKWFAILIVLLCFIFTGLLFAYGAEQRDRKDE